MNFTTKQKKEFIEQSARSLVESARKNPSCISIYHGQLLGMRTVVFHVFGEGTLWKEINRLLDEMNTPVKPPEGANV